MRSFALLARPVRRLVGAVKLCWLMEILTQPAAMHALCANWNCAGQSVGLVPTMGALHAGHLELCRRARAENARFVATIFVNPTQFGPHEDLSNYPRPLERDYELLRARGCDAVFAPAVTAMYGARENGGGTWVNVSPLDEMWEGVTRPGHVRGVATVVTKLFNITRPTRAYFGEKDFQQLRVVQQLVRDLNFSLEIVPVATWREADGLALSSRNAHLNAEERAAAPALYRALQIGVEMASGGERDVAAIGVAIGEVLATEPLLRPQYVAVVDDQTLHSLQTLDGAPARLIAAVFAGETRLIDNVAIR